MILALVLCLCAIPFSGYAREEAPSVVTLTGGQNAEEKIGAATYTYDDLYVQEGLVGLFTAFSSSDITRNSTSKLTWANRVSGGTAATIKDSGSRWKFGENGGIGYRLTDSQWSSYYSQMGIQLPESYAAYDNFTVEVHAAFDGVTNADGSRHLSTQTYGLYTSTVSGFRFDMFMSESFVALHAGATCSMCNRWWLTKTYYNNFNNVTDGTTIFGSYNDCFLAGTEIGDIHMMTVVKSTVNGNITFKQYWDTTPNLGVTSATLTTSAYATVKNSSRPTDPSGLFSLFNGFPGTVYAIRVYNRVLTEAEERQNYAVDILQGMKINPQVYRQASAEDKRMMETALAGYTMNDSAEEVLQFLQFLGGNRATMVNGILTYGNVEPLTGGTVPGFRTEFSVNNKMVSMYENTGYTVYYGAVVGMCHPDGSFKHLTVSLSGGKIVADCDGSYAFTVNGEGGTGAYTRKKGTDIGYAVTVLADDAEHYDAPLAVRGYVLATNGTDTYLAYCDKPTTDQTYGLSSMTELADYFVNDYDGRFDLIYQYINDAALRSVLQKAGISARTSVGTSFDLYVNPATGSDTYAGTSAKPFATLAKAYAAMKTLLSSEDECAVTIHLSAGVHRVDGTLSLSASDIKASKYSIRLVGEGKNTIVTTTKNYGTLTASGNEYQTYLDPGMQFRYLYDSNFDLIPLTHKGDNENYVTVGTVDNTGTTVKMYLPSSLFDGTSTYRGAEVHLTVEWDFNIIHIDHVDYSDKSGSNVAVYVYPNEFGHMAVYGNVAGRQAWVVNHPSYLNTTETTYYYDADTGLLRIGKVSGGRNFTSLSVEIPTADQALTFTDVSDVTIEGISFTGVDNTFVTAENGVAGGQAGSSAKIYTDPGKAKVDGGFLELAAVFVKNSTRFTFRNNRIFNVGGDGFSARGVTVDLTVESNEFSHIGESGMRIGLNGSWTNSHKNLGVLISNNYVHHTGELFVQCPGVVLTSAMDTRVVGNTVTNTTYSAFSLGWRWNEADWTYENIGNGSNCHLYNVEVANNYITDFMTCMRDGAAIYILGGNARYDQPQRFNFMHDNYVVISEESAKHAGTRWAMGYYHDGSGSNWYDTNNVIIGTATSGYGSFIPMYIQSIAGQVAHNDTTVGNYGISCSAANDANGFYGGYTRLTDTSNDMEDHKGVDRGNCANNFIYTSVANLKSGTMLTDGNPTAYRTPVTAPGKNAANNVAAIYAAAGSSLAPKGSDGNLGITAAPNERTQMTNGAVNPVSVSDHIDTEGTLYEITFYNGDKLFATLYVMPGEIIPAPDGKPTKSASAEFTYTFTGWEGLTDTTVATKNTSFTASFRENKRSYSVKFFDAFGGTLQTTSVPYGTAIADVLPADQNKPHDLEFVYTFTGWVDAQGNTVDTVTGTLKLYPAYETRAVTAADHTGSFWQKATADEHLGFCTVCGADVYEAHTGVVTEWEDGKHNLCSVCGEELPMPSVKITVSSRTLSSDSPFVTVTGGGEYAYQATVTVTAPAVKGYHFLGWMTDVDGGALYTTLTANFPAEGDITLYAVYEEDIPVDIEVNGVGVTVNGRRQFAGSYYNTFARGEEITLGYAGTDTFLYWKNANGAIVSEKTGYTFTVTEKTMLTAVTLSDIGEEKAAHIDYVNDYGRVLRSFTCFADDDASFITEPAGPSRMGGVFAGWSLMPSQILSSIAGGQHYIRVTPIYRESGVTYKVTVNILGESTVYPGLSGGDVFRATAPEIEGKQFSHWVNDAGARVSSLAEYAFRVTGNTVLRAVYVNEGEEVDAECIVNFDSITADAVNGASKIHISVTHEAPTGYTVLGNGVLYSTEELAEEKLVVGGDGVRASNNVGNAPSGTHILHLSVKGKESMLVSFRGYMTVREEATGNIFTIYTEIRRVSHSSLSFGTGVDPVAPDKEWNLIDFPDPFKEQE